MFHVKRDARESGWWWPASWALRGRIRHVQPVERVRRCGLPAGADPCIVRREDGASWEGTWQCESAWACPVCSARRRSTVAGEIVAGVTRIGGTVQMVTLTVRHRADVELRDAIEALRSAWGETRHDGTWCRWWRDHVRASSRAIEITRGQHGWHPHIHLLLVLEAPLERTAACAPGAHAGYERDLLAERWCRATARGPAGHDWTADWLWGVQVSAPVDVARETSVASIVARYVSKAGLEVAGAGKSRTSTSPWRIAERAAGGDRASMARWREYCDATRGMHALHSDARLRAACEESAADRREEDTSTELGRYVVPVEAARALAWAERAWHPQALRVPLVIVESGGDPDLYVRAVLDAYATRDPAMLECYRDALQMPGA